MDEISLQLAFIVAVAIRRQIWAYSSELYLTMGCLLVIIDYFIAVLNNSMHSVLKRGYYVEFMETIKHCFFVFAVVAIYMFATQYGASYSRIVLSLTLILHVFFGYVMRITGKFLIKKYHLIPEKKSSMLVVTTPENAAKILKRLGDSETEEYRITGVVLTTKDGKETCGGYPVVADIDGAADYIMKTWVDSVYVDVSNSDERILKFMDDCTLMGIPTHYHVPNMTYGGAKRFSEKIGGTMVLTSTVNYATPGQLLIKRCFDILAGLIGSLIAFLIIGIVGPIIKKRSPGPVLFTQERIGKNGKPFIMYKIRSMYVNADAQKQELMDQNRVKDGMMFKLDFDPRIIGNEILSDGSYKTGIGEFIRKTSLDEFPQFFCVLKGDMSTIGTRPPTKDEYERYEYHHRKRVAIKPGITGLWQVSGRSEITDFEEVVRLDTEYITNWSLGLDLKILVKTFVVWLSGKGAL